MTDKKLNPKWAKLIALHANFAAALPNRVAAFATEWRAVKATNSRGEALDELIRSVHSLAGSGGTFGYHRLGEVARELEQTLIRWSQAPEHNLSSEHLRIDELLGVLDILASTDADEHWNQPYGIVPAPAEDTNWQNNRRVVLIEDDALEAEDLATQLTMFGWEVNAFTNAKEAHSILSEPIPPAVIIDVILPEDSKVGFDLIRKIHSQQNFSVPYVVISNRNDWESRLAAVRSGAAAYLVKPIDISALEEQLDRITNRSLPEPYRVLVVDDDPMLADYCVQFLTAAGMDVHALPDPSELLVAIGQHQPEIILLDLYMPQCSGIEALKVIRQDAQFDSLPIVFLSAESDRIQQQSILQMGAEDFYKNPLPITI
jgi:Response regulator containing a CheY-like receiver domain and a GGDEF domain